jgi:isopropylmalate/homocitrate/citramalate synthase
MNNSNLNPREGKNLAQVFSPLRLGEYPNGVLFAATQRGAVVVDGLMRNATVKANGDEIVDALNRAHALGWAQSRGNIRVVTALRDLLVETFDVTESAAEIGATMICDRIGVSSSSNLRDGVDEFLKIAREYKHYPLGFHNDLHTGVLLAK